MIGSRIAFTVMVALNTFPSQACDLRINDADVLVDKMVRYFERTFPTIGRRCVSTSDVLKCDVASDQIGVNFDRHSKLDIALFNAGAGSARLDVLRDLWAEVGPHMYFGGFEKPSDASIAAAISGQGPRIFLQNDNCGLVFAHEPAGSTFIVMGGYRK